MIFSIGTHPPVPPVCVLSVVLEISLNSVGHRVNQISKRYYRVNRVPDNANNLFARERNVVRLLCWIVRFDDPRSVVLNRFAHKPLNLQTCGSMQRY